MAQPPVRHPELWNGKLTGVQSIDFDFERFEIRWFDLYVV